MILFVMPSMTKIPREPVHHPPKSRMCGIFYQTQKYLLLLLLKTKREKKRSIKQGWEGYSKSTPFLFMGDLFVTSVLNCEPNDPLANVLLLFKKKSIL